MPMLALYTQFSVFDIEQFIDQFVATMSHEASIRKFNMKAIITITNGMKIYLPFGMELDVDERMVVYDSKTGMWWKWSEL